jgi:ADP-ribosylglycohydrolase
MRMRPAEEHIQQPVLRRSGRNTTRGGAASGLEHANGLRPLLLRRVSQTVPCVLYILAQHGADAEEAIVRAVNDTKDKDTTASIVGAAIGMLHGARALPQRWKESLTGRTEADDEGRMFDLIAQAKARFWAQAAGPAA